MSNLKSGRNISITNLSLFLKYFVFLFQFYIITSQGEFEEIVNMKCAVQIDFSNYTLLIGSKTFTTGASVYDEKVVANNYEIVYTVTFWPDDSFVVLEVPYHVIIDDLSGKDIRIEEVIKEPK